MKDDEDRAMVISSILLLACVLIMLLANPCHRGPLVGASSAGLTSTEPAAFPP